ncbi:ABC transporter permease [Nocardioides sp.]|uniref:ABC transporter permease n=1 Tax=Nocardioides sp. TaxID=35761 RepID=UPI0027345820|nr:ABC transporter permease [Nocardioides sp.]MDP3891498.1 ABC transporter permease [Nocardioides sp.]
MSTTHPAPAGGPMLDISQTARVPFSRLVRVEWRKMLDTRGGFWLMVATGILLVITVGLVLLVVALTDDPLEIGANGFSQILTIPLSLLLPVFPILTVTSEWGQRTGLVTFALEPHRLRVMLAKAARVVLLALATIAVALVLGAVGNVATAAMDGIDAKWDLDLGTLVLTILLQLLYFLMAYGFGTVFLNTPAAIAFFYVIALMLPLFVYSTLYAFFEWAQDLIPWIDLQYASAPFLDPDDDPTAMDGVRMLVTVIIWIVIPLVVGMRRVLSSEPK